MKATRFALLTLPLIGAAACARVPAPASSAVKSDDAELHARFLEPAAGACRDVAIAAVRKLEAQNGWSRPVKGAFLASAHSDGELIRVLVDGDSYLVNTESLGGDPCKVYGLSLATEAQPLNDATPDAGIDQDATSDSCKAAAKAVITSLEGLNDYGVQLGKFTLVAAHSDREIFSVSVKRDAGAVTEDTYVVNAETFGGDPCMIYGLQAQSDAVDLGAYASPEDLLTEMAAAYELAGQINNYAPSLKIAKSDARAVEAYDAVVLLDTQEEMRAALKECVFMTKGAYGEHITAERADELAYRFAPELQSLAESWLMTIGKQSILAADGDLIDSGCSLTLGVGAHLLILDAHSFD